MSRFPAARFAGGVVLACSAAVAWCSPAWAHDEPVAFAPPDGATVTTEMHEVSVTFEEPPGEGPVSLTVSGADGRRIDVGPAVVNGDVLTVPVHAAVVGSCRATFSIVSDDGHPVTGSFTFTLSSASGHTASAAPAVKSTRAERQGTHALLPVMAAMVLVGGAVAVVRSFRRMARLTGVGNS